MNWPRSWGPLEIAEYRIVKATLDFFEGNLSQTAEALKLSFRCIQYKVRQYQKLGLAISWNRRANTIDTHLDNSTSKASELR